MLTLSCLYWTLLLESQIFSSYGDLLPEVDTPLGKVVGFWKTSYDGRKYAAFEGIPYAKPPVGDLRFEEPQPIEPWTGIWKATTPLICIQDDQIGKKYIHGEEDCLYLNVYIPTEFVNNSRTFDVVAYIHGGGFKSGSGLSIDTNMFMDRALILVTMNYRLGLFGFLSTEDHVVPGNNGLKDQVLALEWIRDNIASFGGNPGSVTLIGLSSGGSSVHLHYFSPLSKGLFVRGLSQTGGNALVPWGYTKNPLDSARKMAVYMGCPQVPSESLKRCLQQRPAKKMLEMMPHFYGFGNMPFVPFSPVVETNSKRPFMDRDPLLKLKEGEVLDVPWIMSVAAEEGLMPTAYYWLQLDKIDAMWGEIAPYFLHYNDTIPETKKSIVARQVLDYYLGPGEKINKKNFKKFTQMLSDGLYGFPSETAAKVQAAVTKSPVYFYFFNYREGQNKAVEFFSDGTLLEGIAHGDETVYFYGIFVQHPFSEKDLALRKACLDMLYSFASTGYSKPSFDGTDIWKPTVSTELVYLNITGPDDMKLQRTKNLTPVDFWSKLESLKYKHTMKDEL